MRALIHCHFFNYPANGEPISQLLGDDHRVARAGIQLADEAVDVFIGHLESVLALYGIDCDR